MQRSVFIIRGVQCFIFHFYAGVRAGGGIGDELESPYGDDLEYWRMLYDISFFFFVIIILLAIMQGTYLLNFVSELILTLLDEHR